MALRRYQADLKKIIDNEIKTGRKTFKNVIIEATPGAGKSLLPVIISDLIPIRADFLLWVVPRDSLKYQGEADFINNLYPTDRRVRVANNTDDPLRGLDGCVTTYQGIAANPELWIDLFKRKKGILILDEFHHISEDGTWEKPMKILYQSCKYFFGMSGTLHRNDRKEIAFVKSDIKIVYGRKQAIQEGSILPVYFETIDASGKYEDLDGFEITFDNLGSKVNNLFTALRTKYAYQLLNSCIQDWLEIKKKILDAKLLIVCPDIKTARKYLNGHKYPYPARIATSENTDRARDNIRAFKNNEVEILITVGMAYEGLSVRAITHIACLTQIRSIPWLEQLFARANRIYRDKTCGKIYGPKDSKFLEAIKMINMEQRLSAVKQEIEEKSKKDPEDEMGPKATIIPLHGEAIGELFDDARPVPYMPASEMEALVKKQIRDIIELYLKNRCTHGGIFVNTQYLARRKIIHRRLKQIVPKKIDEMTMKELNKAFKHVCLNYK